MASPASTHETITVSENPTLLNVNMTNVTKLTASNFLMWSRQVLALLDGYNLSGYVDGSVKITSPTNTAEGVQVPNPAYALWRRQDRLIYSALLGAITVSIQPLLSTTTTSAQIWETLVAIYAKPSRGHILQLPEQIKHWTKGTKTIDAYVQGFTTRFDQIALLGKLYDLEDQIEHILEGLPEEYKTIVDQIAGRDSTPSVAELHGKLLNQEAKLQSKTSSTVPITANAAAYRHLGNNTTTRNYQGNRTSNNGNRQNQPWQPPNTGYHRSDQSPRGYQGRCQLCGVHGHSARRCSQLQNGNVPYKSNARNQPQPTS